MAWLVAIVVLPLLFVLVATYAVMKLALLVLRLVFAPALANPMKRTIALIAGVVVGSTGIAAATSSSASPDAKPSAVRPWNDITA
jgi:hypothetical protein